MLHHSTLLCQDTTTTDTIISIFDFSIAPALLFYAYIPAAFLALVLGLFVVRQHSHFKLPQYLFFAVTTLYLLYLINDTVQWVAIPAAVVHFSWQLILLIKGLLLVTAYYFATTFVTGRDLSFRSKLLLASLLAPIILILPTNLNILSFNLTSCESDIGPFYAYIYFLEIVISIAVVWRTVKVVRHAQDKRTKLLALFSALGILSLILFLFATDLIGEYTGAFEILMLAPLGMLAFLATMAYLIVRFNAFNAKMLGVQALIVTIASLVGSQLLFIQSATNFVLTILTLLFTLAAGFFLIRSVKREVKQREEIQKLAENLKRANDRLKRLDQLKSEFVSIASHQLRSPLAAMLGYASMLKDGSYGKLPVKAGEASARIEESARLMATSVEDYLNVSRIEAGHMKYNLTDFSLREQVLHITDDLRPLALKQNIILLYRTKLESDGQVHADKGKTEQILHNLINNALKYTKQGTITVVLHDDTKQGKLYVDVSDTGIGMSKDTLDSIFEKFERGSNANSTNIHGTGLGLYTALKLAEAMGGTITAHSDGEGKGSRFTLELPLVG